MLMPNEPALLLQLYPLIMERRTVQILDFSKGGLTIRSSQPLDVGVMVQIRTPASFILGEVRYCERRHGKFHSGIQVQDSVVKAVAYRAAS